MPSFGRQAHCCLFALVRFSHYRNKQCNPGLFRAQGYPVGVVQERSRTARTPQPDSCVVSGQQESSNTISRKDTNRCGGRRLHPTPFPVSLSRLFERSARPTES